MKKIISLLLVLIMIGSTFVFCNAEAKTEIKVDVRLEPDDKGNVDMVFSIPENANLAEFSFQIYYNVASTRIENDSAVSFKSNLPSDEEKNVSWKVDTDLSNLDQTYGDNPCCFVSGFTKDGESLNNGGDLFTLKFYILDGAAEDIYNFTVVTNYITNGNGEFYTEAIVPDVVAYGVENSVCIPYAISYRNFVPDVSMEIIDEVSKLAWDYSPTVHREFFPIANDMLFPGESSFSGSNGGRVYSQGVAPAYKYISELKVYIRVYGVNHGTDYLTIQIRNSYHDINTVYSNNYAVSATGDRWIGGGVIENNGSAKRIALNVNQTYWLAFSYCFPDVAGNAYGLVADNVNNSYPLYYTAANQHASWSSLNGCNAFDINYDMDMHYFDYYVSAMGSSFDVDDETNFNNATTYYNRIKNNAYQWNVVSSTARNNYSSASSAISNAKTKINNFKNAVTTINGGGITISDDQAINDALAAYNSLSTAQKNYSGVGTSKSTLDGYRTTCTNLINGKNAVVNAISALAPVTWSKKSSVESARASYNALNQDQKNNVTNYSTLTSAESTISGMETARNNFTGAVNAIDTVDLDKADEISAAETAYTTLTNYNDSTLTSDLTSYINTLNTAKSTLTTLQTQVDDFKTAVSNLSPGDTETVETLKSTYAGFTDGQKAAVAEEYTSLLAFDVIGLIDACYPVDIDKGSQIETARDAYDELTDDQKALVGEEYANKLAEAEALYAEMTAGVNGFINYVTEIGEVDITDLEKIEGAEALYENFTDLQKEAVADYIETLTTARTTIDEIIAKIEALDLEIAAIPTPYGIEYKDFINAANDKYITFTDDEKAHLQNEQMLLDALAALKDSEDRIKEVVDLIESIGDVTFGKIDIIEAAREAYDNLSDVEKAEVTNLSVLEEAEEIIAIILDCYFGDVNLDDNIDIMDALFILQVSINKIPVANLELKQKIAGDLDADGQVEIEDALLVLHYVVGKIYYFPAEDYYWA